MKNKLSKFSTKSFLVCSSVRLEGITKQFKELKKEMNKIQVSKEIENEVLDLIYERIVFFGYSVEKALKLVKK